MKLDVSIMRHMCKEDWRVLTAVEMGMKNHELVPVDIIVNIAKLRHGGAHKFLNNLHRFKLIAHDASKYDGYRLTYQGYDLLALHTFVARGVIASFGRKIGVGKESDVYLAQNANGEEIVVKLARLGRTSFRTIKRNRDYMLHRKAASWLYMSRLAALREYAFMSALHSRGFPTPTPIDQNRHVVLMSKVDGAPMYQFRAGQMPRPGRALESSLDILVRLAEHGLIHCDFNEFNLMVSDEGAVTLIDFPQMISTSHDNAPEYFSRDLRGIVKFFAMKLRMPIPENLPDLQSITAISRVDEDVRASGFSSQHEKDISGFLDELRANDGPAVSETGSDDDVEQDGIEGDCTDEEAGQQEQEEHEVHGFQRSGLEGEAGGEALDGDILTPSGPWVAWVASKSTVHATATTSGAAAEPDHAVSSTRFDFTPRDLLDTQDRFDLPVDIADTTPLQLQEDEAEAEVEGVLNLGLTDDMGSEVSCGMSSAGLASNASTARSHNQRHSRSSKSRQHQRQQPRKPESRRNTSKAKNRGKRS